MNQLFNKMRALSIRDLKQRRHQIFEHTRRIMMAETPEEESYQETENVMSMEPMEEEPKLPHQKRNKKQQQNNRIRRYWRKLLQVNDWMLEVPDNLSEFYVCARPEGNKCLVIFKDFRMELRDKSGSIILQSEIKSKLYDNSVFEAYYSSQRKTLVFSDLIAWKSNPMTSNEFEFRCAWLLSNLNIANLQAWIGINVFFPTYYHCNLEGLKQAYTGEVPYQRQGLAFIHKDSFYLHGFNPNVLVWKDQATSKYLLTEIEESKNGCKGIGFLNKNGEVKTIENVTLFTVHRQQIDATHRFMKFTYTNMAIENLEEDKVNVHFQNLKTAETVRNYNGPIDSLGKLLYKCKIKESMVNIEQIAKKCNFTPTFEQ